MGAVRARSELASDVEENESRQEGRRRDESPTEEDEQWDGGEKNHTDRSEEIQRPSEPPSPSPRGGGRTTS